MTLRSAEKKLYLGGALKDFYRNRQAVLYRYMGVVIPDAPQLYWPGQDASGHVRDFSGNGNDSTTEAGALTYGDTSTPFPDNSVSIAKAATGDIHRNATGTAINNISMEVWVNLTSGVGSNRTLVGADQTGKGWAIIMTSATKFAVVVQNVAVLANCSATLTTGTWYHIVAVRDAGTWKYYFNGALDGATPGAGLPIANTAGFVGVGRDASAMAFKWAHFAYYETALTATQIAKHYNAGVA